MELCLRAATLAGGLEPLFFSTTSLPFHPFPATWSTAGRRPEQPRMVPPLSCCPLAPGPVSPSIRPFLCPASTAGSLREQELTRCPLPPGLAGPGSCPSLCPASSAGERPRISLHGGSTLALVERGAGTAPAPAAEPLSLLTHSRSSSQIQKKMEGDDGEEAYLAAMASVRAREGAAVAPPLG